MSRKLPHSLLPFIPQTLHPRIKACSNISSTTEDKHAWSTSSSTAKWEGEKEWGRIWGESALQREEHGWPVNACKKIPSTGLLFQEKPLVCCMYIGTFVSLFTFNSSFFSPHFLLFILFPSVQWLIHNIQNCFQRCWVKWTVNNLANPDREIRHKLIKSKTHTKGVMETQNSLCESTFE